MSTSGHSIDKGLAANIDELVNDRDFEVDVDDSDDEEGEKNWKYSQN